MSFMPIVCPIQGVTDTDWTPAWLETFALLQVDLDACPFGPICRAPRSDGLLGLRSCTSDEISVFINKVLGVADADKLSSHSFKHTTFSWASAYGIDEPARIILGHHELQGSQSMAVYSRDMLTRPLQLYCSMLTNIRGDHFRPDESRTSRMLDLMRIQKAGTAGPRSDPHTMTPPETGAQGVDLDDEAVPTTPLEDAASSAMEKREPGQVESDEDSGSLASTSSDSLDEDGNAGNEAVPAALSVEDLIEGPVLRNIKSRVVHKCSRIQNRTLCNRLTSAATFEFLAEGCSTLNARCSRCFKGQVITTPVAMATAFDMAKAKRIK